MRRTVTRVLAAMVAGAALSSLGLTGASASGPATGARQWVSRYNDPASSDNLAAGLTVGPGGKTVYVTGSSFSSPGWAYVTVAYDTATGAQRWTARYNGPARRDDEATSVTVSPTGSRVFVTGFSVAATARPPRLCHHRLQRLRAVTPGSCGRKGRRR